MEKCVEQIELKKEYQKILRKKSTVLIVVIIGFILLLMSAVFQDRISFVLGSLGSLLLIFITVYMAKLIKTLNNIHKKFKETYPKDFYNVKEPTYLDICNYLKANDFTSLERPEVIFGVKYFKTNSKIYTNHNILSVMVLLTDDDFSIIHKKYSSEIKAFTKEIDKKYNLKHKKVYTVKMNLTFTSLEQIQTTKPDIVNLSVIYNKTQETLHYSSYIKYFDFSTGSIVYKEIDKCISSLFRV